jgi:lipoprotein-releasing system ATP-binding protein
MALRRGSSVAVIGPSGAGKSTLLHLLGGLDRPTAGQVLMDGVDMYRLSDKARARLRNARVGFVFQFYHLLPEFTALENVMLPGMIQGRPSAWLGTGGPKVKGRAIREKAKDLLRSVGLEDRASHRPGELSGGESQRVAIARALMNGPQVLLCDEPTGNLDSTTSESIYELLFGLKSKTGMSIVIVTHDDALSKMTDEVLRIRDGKAVQAP